MPIIFKQHQGFIDFSNEVLSEKFELENVITIVQMSDAGDIQFVAIFDNFTEHDVEMNIASKGNLSATRLFLKACYQYAFETCGKNRVTAKIKSDNSKSIQICLRLGFVYEGSLRNWFGEFDAYVFGMLRKECKWLR